MSVTVPIYGFGGGDGAPLNFKVVGNLQPDNPKENTIWVDTDVPITSWIFSAEEPSPAEAGMVWISVGTSSSVAFNALRKNSVQVYPLSAKQYISGAWVNVTAMSYQNGEWSAWVTNLVVLKDGTLYVGTWSVATTVSQFSDGTITATYDENKGNGGWLSEKIDTTGHTKLVFRCKVSKVGNTSSGFNFGLSTQTFSGISSYVDQLSKMVAFVPINAANNNFAEYELELGGIPAGEYYLAVVATATYSIDYIELK